MNKYVNFVQQYFHKKKKQKHDETVMNKYKKVYCVIQRNECHLNEGLFACFLSVIKCIKLATDYGMIPVVDMQTYDNPYLTKKLIGKENAWEYYFKQPAGIGLNEVCGKGNIIYMHEPPYHAFPSDSMDFLTNPEDINWWREFVKKHITLSDEAEEYLHRYDELHHKILRKKTLGVYLRGTDYQGLRPCGHAVVPNVEESIDSVRNAINENGYEQIFLSVEDNIFQQRFMETFGEKVLYIDQFRVAKREKWDGAVTHVEEFQMAGVKEAGMRYLCAILLMAETDALYAARCCGSIGALLFSRGYSWTKYHNNGRYRKNRLNQVEKDKNIMEYIP